MKAHRYLKYSGSIESSKSIVNRALILKEIHPNLKINYSSRAKDVLLLEKCLQQFKDLRDKSETHKSSGVVFDVGSGGTTFRFLALFLSKYVGTWNIKLSTQLFNRPHEDLVKILSQLGVSANFKSADEAQGTILKLRSNSWLNQNVTVDFSKSSQFFSGIALAASDFKGVFTIHCLNRSMSAGYEDITLSLLKRIGIQINSVNDSVFIERSDLINAEVNIGADWSSVCSLLSFCFCGAEIEINNIDFKSSEPDLRGLDILKDLGLEFEVCESIPFSKIRAKLSQLDSKKTFIDLKNNPDLFPQFAVLMSQICLEYGTVVQIRYMSQLIYKESDRLNAIIQILSDLGFSVQTETDILIIKSNSFSKEVKINKTFSFDSKRDHRLIMCFELLKSFGYKINYNHPEEVKKSFSNFFEIINGV